MKPARPAVTSLARTASGARPYAPSWVDHLSEAVCRLPLPPWLVYLAAGVVLVLLHAAASWGAGGLPVGMFDPFSVLALGGSAYVGGLLHYLDDSAQAALARFRPALRLDEAGYERLCYEFTTMPARPALVATLLGGLYGLTGIIWLDEVMPQGQPATLLAMALQLLGPVVSYATAGVWIYHTVRQLRMVSRLYTTQTRIDLFQLAPLYAFSVLAARTAIGLALLSYAWATLLLFSSAASMTDELLLASAVEVGFVTLIVGLTFFWPLWGVHRLLEDEKTRLKDEVAGRVKAILAELNRRTDAGDFAAAAGINDALESMLKQRTVLDKISTWPWQPDTLRGIVAAVLLPILIWFITRVLERVIVF